MSRKSVKRKRDANEQDAAEKQHKRKAVRPAVLPAHDEPGSFRLPDEHVAQITGYVDESETLSTLRASCRTLARIGIARMWACCIVRVGHKPDKGQGRKKAESMIVKGQRRRARLSYAGSKRGRRRIAL
ncbi:hypothetical protein SVAN01_10869 [Stagonosporopsis vannaccii]|nr:hypothetical protein SVAN01_10869 [Stagonosporopsis vannaccii]